MWKFLLSPSRPLPPPLPPSCSPLPGCSVRPAGGPSFCLSRQRCWRFGGGGGAEGGDGPEAYGGIGGFEGLDGGERIASNGVGNLPDAFEVDFSFAGEIGDGMAFFFDEVGHDAFGEAAGVAGLAAAFFKGGFG